MQAEILDLLRRCRDEFGTAIVLITHNMGVVADLADRVAVMYQGEIVEEADVRTLFAAPQDDYTQQLLAAVPRLGQGTARTAERAAGAPAGWAEAAPVVEATDLRIVYPGRLRPARTSSRSTASASRSAPARCSAWSARAASGKTTIGRAIAGLTKVTGGSLQVLGAEMNGVKERDVPAAARADRLRLPGPGVQLQPAAHHRRVRRRAAGRARAGRRARRPPAAGSTSCSRRCSCPKRSATASRTSSPAASASAPAWPARSRSNPSC